MLSEDGGSFLLRVRLDKLELRWFHFILLVHLLPRDICLDTFDGAKPRFLNRGKKRRSVSTLSIPRASDRGVEWVDFFHVIVKFSSYHHIRGINIFCQDNILWKYFTNDNKMIPNILTFDLDII
jgi:hypothetical protein